MANVHIDPDYTDEERRRRLFAGDVVVYTHVPAIAEFAEFTRDMITELFAPHDPIMIQETYSPEQLADLLIEFKPRWIHHPESKKHVRKVVEALGGDPEQIHADVPKLRTAFPQGGLSTGIAYAFQAHRDTWYGAPAAQINWWMPVWPVAENNVMEFFPRGFGAQVENNSGDYDYYVANAWRGRIKDFSGGKDMRVHPAPVNGIADDEPRITVVPPVGGIMLFSGDQLHASLPNLSGRTRYSIDFRTVAVPDVHAKVGAPMADVACTGTALRDFVRMSDGAPFTEEEVAPHDSESTAAEAVKVFSPTP
ncbi:hypothetical protein [Pseudonocardia sp.]|jgi:hypothetical protein|uniref:hypothetical protein n=1 Tax=Pseudonocardia sp. TaxID=60912 RepID=UPI0031FBC26F